MGLCFRHVAPASKSIHPSKRRVFQEVFYAGPTLYTRLLDRHSSLKMPDKTEQIIAEVGKNPISCTKIRRTFLFLFFDNKYIASTSASSLSDSMVCGGMSQIKKFAQFAARLCRALSERVRATFRATSRAEVRATSRAESSRGFPRFV